MQICDGYFQSSAPRELLKPNRRRSQHPENRRKEGRVLCSTPSPLLNFLGEKPPLRHTNGYSIAEILLVFGIIAGVLIGVWAIYTMVSEDTDRKNAIAEIQMIQQAALAHKRGSGANDYVSYTGVSFAAARAMLRPYLGSSALAEGVNTFGEIFYIYTFISNEDLQLAYYGIPHADTCVRILEQFGIVDHSGFYPVIKQGDAITGFRGSDSFETACDTSSPNASTLYILID